MVARQIDAVYSPASRAIARDTAKRMAALVSKMSREQLEACHVELNHFFQCVPFSETIPVVVEIERIWPHHIETLPEANRRLDRIRKGGEYAVLFSPEKMRNIYACIQEIEASQ